MTYIIITLIIGFIAFKFMNRPAIDLTPEEIIAQIKDGKALMIDVRTPGEYKEGHLALTTHNYNLNSGEFENKLAQLDKNKTYYLYCRTGNRSGQALRIMKNHGFNSVHNIGGFSALVNQGFEAAK